jgi:putative FmdB family regulatory protein
MPIYEYRCSTCGFENEYLQKVSDPRLTDCPDCGKPTFNKLISAAGFQLKGNGWYVTDFKNNGAKAKADKGNGDKAKGDKTDNIAEKAESKEPKKEEKSEPACGAGACPSCS